MGKPSTKAVTDEAARLREEAYDAGKAAAKAAGITPETHVDALLAVGADFLEQLSARIATHLPATAGRVNELAVDLRSIDVKAREEKAKASDGRRASQGKRGS